MLQHLRAGNRIAAIKAYREHFGTGLKDAKEAVERIAAGQPAGTIPGARGRGLAVGVAAAVVILAGALPLFLLQSGGDPPAAAAPSAGAATPPTPASRALRPEAEEEFAVPLLTFGSEGTGAGRFQDARSIGVDAAGRIYVGEYSGGRVQVFDSAGAFITQWTADRRMPLLDLEAARDGAVYVVQSGRIRRYDGATGRLLTEIRPQAGGGYDDVALALDGSIWALASRGGLFHLAPDGSVLRRLDLSELLDEDADPSRVAVSGTGEIYLIDRWSGVVYRLSAEGRFVDRFGGSGDRADRLASPTDLALDGRGRLYIADVGRGIRVFSPDGALIATVGSGVVFGLALNDRDELYAAYRNEHQVVKFRLPR